MKHHPHRSRLLVALVLIAAFVGGRVVTSAVTGGAPESVSVSASSTSAGAEADAGNEPSTDNGSASSPGASSTDDPSSDPTNPSVIADESWAYQPGSEVIEVVPDPAPAPIEPAPSSSDPATTQTPGGLNQLPKAGDVQVIDIDPPVLGASVETEAIGSVVRYTISVEDGYSPIEAVKVDFRDGSSIEADERQLAALRHGSRLVVMHAYEPTLEYDFNQVRVEVTDEAGDTETAAAAVWTRAYYRLAYSPITVRALNDCDTFGKGDFELTWNQDGRERKSFFDLGAGDTKVEDRFRNRIGGVFYDTDVQFELELRENDPTGAFLLAPWKWDGFKFTPSSVDPGVRGFVAQLGDHHYEVIRSSSDDQGVAGDDDCATVMNFTVSLHMVDDIDEAKRLLDGPPAR